MSLALHKHSSESQASSGAQAPCISIHGQKKSIPMDNIRTLSCFFSEISGITKFLWRPFLLLPYTLYPSSPQNVQKWKTGHFSIHCMESMKAWHTSELCAGIWVGLGKSTDFSGKHTWVCVYV